MLLLPVVGVSVKPVPPIGATLICVSATPDTTVYPVVRTVNSVTTPTLTLSTRTVAPFDNVITSLVAYVPPVPPTNEPG